MKEIRYLLVSVLALYGVSAGFGHNKLVLAITIILQALLLLYAIYLTFKKEK